MDVTIDPRAIQELREAMAEVRTLRGIVPICASCKKIRDDSGYWDQVESYVAKRTDATFSHGICPECMAKLFPDPEAGRGRRRRP